MDKRKSLTETNGRQKFFHRHPTIIDAQHKSIHAGKSMPKIKLTTNDKSSDFRSISSPRLKNFPAEEIRRVQKSPRLNVFPFSGGIRAPAPFGNNPNSCQGDSIPEPLLPQPILQNHNQIMSQPFLTHPMSNQPQHSEVILNSNSIQRPPDRQIHRPFVPNTVRNLNPRQHVNVDNQTFENPINNNFVENRELPHKANIQSQNGPRHLKKIDDLSECEKQPVGGRCAELHRLAQLSEKKQSAKTNLSMSEARISNPSYQNPEYYHQHQQQMQPSEFYHDFHHNQQPNVGRIPTAGMTSQQNFEVNRVKSYPNNFYQHPTNQRQSAQAIVKPTVTWPQTRLSNIFRPHQTSQHAKNIPRNNLRPNNSPRNQQQQELQEYPPQRSENYPKTIKKKLQFTPAMIRDQELLVTTMRQQEIPEDIMKRQFDALLNEQTRQLIYEHQLEQSQEDDEVSDNIDIRRRRKVSKIDDDGKPEWMMHITPPWIPYALSEKMENNTSGDGKKCVKLNANLNQQQEQQQYPEYNYNPNDQQSEIPYQNAYPQYQQPMDHRGHHHENCYNQPKSNSAPCVQQSIANTYPTSILKTRNDNSPMMKQNHRSNNGLQDSETVKRALEELNNAQTQKGFEYLVNANKKQQHVQLNGIQDSDDPSVHNLAYQLMPTDVKQDVRRGPSANGLENKRNPNNPPPPPTLHLKNCGETVSEYPRQRVNRNIDNYYVMPAEKENWMMMNSINNGYQNNSSAFQNSTVGGNARYKNSIQAQVTYQDKGEISGHYNYVIPNNLVRSNSLPPNMYSEYQPIRINDYNGVPNDIHNDYMMAMRSNEVFNEQCVQPNVHMQANIHVPEQYLEARIIGGVKYLARRTECNPHYVANKTTIGNNISSQPIAFY